jgi:NAD(P)-dependent dehydrogenase (short-subunit alcohol dehydrogenase family)
VTSDAGDVARTLAAEGAAVVLVGGAEDAGGIAADIERAGGRAAAFVGSLENDDDRAALAEMLDELFATGDA